MAPFHMFLQRLMISSFHLLVLIHSLSLPTQRLCHDSESSVLLKFKQRFSVNESAASANRSSSPKFMSWKLEGETGDCCRWDGVECDVETGHVIGLDLSSSFLLGSIDSTSTLFSLTHLQKLNLANNYFNYSQIPSDISNLSLLSILNLSTLVLSGTLPASLGNLTKLTSLDLSHNQLDGQIPSSISNLKNLEFLDLSYNNLNGAVNANIFLSLRNLSQLHLSYNTISLLTNNSKSTCLPKFRFLGLDSCNVSEFPEFLRFQEKLEVLSLINNRIRDIPGWMRVGNNGRTRGWDQNPVVLPWPSLRIVDLRYNMLEGPLPLPPPNIYGYLVSDNRLTGEIPPMICHRSSLSLLDVSNNNMSGTIPPCLSKLSDSLAILILKGNNFGGIIPQEYTKGCNLTVLDCSQNQLKGQVPRSLANCKNLEILILAENQLEDNFPFWLGALPGLQVLILQSNNFYGTIRSPTINLQFPKLRIIDLANNAFSGPLPLKSSQSWNAMKKASVQTPRYLESNTTVQVQEMMWRASYEFSMMMTNKGVKTEYEKILNVFRVIDFSSNRFSGEVPASIGSLQGLQSLNLSNNELTGCIPASIENLTQLESLDLSRNKLTGNIPSQLQQLSFLAFLNFSSNRLVGPIPQGNQFSTFQNNSYMDNLALCGDPLSTKCEKIEASPFQSPTRDEGDDSEFPMGVDWVVILAGVVSGLVIGLILGHNINTRYHKWFLNKVGMWLNNRAAN